MPHIHWGRRLVVEQAAKYLMRFNRDARLVGISFGWFFLGFMYCPRKGKVLHAATPE